MELIVSEQPGKKPSVEIDEVNAELKRSLELCHSVVDELRAKLAGHSTRALPANDEEDDDTRLG